MEAVILSWPLSSDASVEKVSIAARTSNLHLGYTQLLRQKFVDEAISSRGLLGELEHDGEFVRAEKSAFGVVVDGVIEGSNWLRPISTDAVLETCVA